VPYDYDLVVIGSGPAGEKGAARAAYFGKRVAVIEKEREPGGAAVHTGTLPSKTLRETALFLSGHRQRALYGLHVSLDAHLAVPKLLSRKDAVRKKEVDRITWNLERHGVDLLKGRARFVDAHTVEITGEGGFELNAIAMNGAPDVGDLNVSNSALESLLDSLEQRFGFRSATSTAGSRTAPPARAMTPPPPRPEPFRNEPAAIEPPPVIEAPAPEEAPAETRDAMAEAGPAGEPAVTPSADEAPPAVPPTNDPDDVLASLARALAPRRPGQR